MGGDFSHVFEIFAWARFSYSLYNLYGSTIRTNWVIRQNFSWLCVKDHMRKDRMRKITSALNGGIIINLLPQSFSATNLTAFKAILSIFSLRMRRNSYLWASGINSDTSFWFFDPDFLTGNDITAIWRLVFAFDMLNVHHIFYFRSSWPTDLESLSYVFPCRWKFSPSLKLIQSSVAYNYRGLAADTSRDLCHWSYMAGHMVNPFTKFEVSKAICCWVMISDTRVWR